MITGVNLGNWLVLEKWMSPALFDGTTGGTRRSCALTSTTSRKHERLKAPRDSYIARRDFAYLASHGINIVRTGPVLHLRRLLALCRLHRVPRDPDYARDFEAGREAGLRGRIG
jgi:hypothetical protein